MRISKKVFLVFLSLAFLWSISGNIHAQHFIDHLRNQEGSEDWFDTQTGWTLCLGFVRDMTGISLGLGSAIQGYNYMNNPDRNAVHQNYENMPLGSVVWYDQHTENEDAGHVGFYIGTENGNRRLISITNNDSDNDGNIGDVEITNMENHFSATLLGYTTPSDYIDYAPCAAGDTCEPENEFDLCEVPIVFLTFHGTKTGEQGPAYSNPIEGPWNITAGDEMNFAFAVQNIDSAAVNVYALAIEVQDSNGNFLGYISVKGQDGNARMNLNLSPNQVFCFPGEENQTPNVVTYDFAGRADGEYILIARAFIEDKDDIYEIGRQKVILGGGGTASISELTRIEELPVGDDLVTIGITSDPPTDPGEDPPVVDIPCTDPDDDGNYNPTFWGYVNRCDSYNRPRPGNTICLTMPVLYNGTPPYTYKWDFGDCSPYVYGQTVTHAYSQIGIYTAWCLFTDRTGQKNKMGLNVGVYTTSSGSNHYTITVTQGSYCTISPGTWDMGEGEDKTFIITADTGYAISDVVVDGQSYGPQSSFTFYGVTQNHTLTATAIWDVNDPNNIDDDGDSYNEYQGDCRDDDATIHPGADEIRGDSIDQDCNGEDMTWSGINSEYKITANDGQPDDWFGYHSISVSGDYAIVGALFDNDDGSYSGSAYIFKWNGNIWIQTAKLTASDAASNHRFGNAVAISGDYAIVGASMNGNSETSGAAYIFKRNGEAWIEQAKLVANDEGGYFGISVGISGDYAVVGAPNNDNNAVNDGAAYIFKRSGETWTLQKEIIASDGTAEDLFGHSVAISGDYVVVAAIYDDVIYTNSGSAYVFHRDGTDWIEQTKLTASSKSSGGTFGHSLAIDNDTIFIGEKNYTYVFRFNGSAWIQETRLRSNDWESGDAFGSSVSISSDYAVIGASSDDDKGLDSGSAYVYRRNGSTWTEELKLTASDGTASVSYGASAAIFANKLLIGAFLDNNSQGSVYAYNLWVEELPGVNNDPPIINRTIPISPGVVVLNGLLPVTFSVTDIDGDNIPYSIVVRTGSLGSIYSPGVPASPLVGDTSEGIEVDFIYDATGAPPLSTQYVDIYLDNIHESEPPFLAATVEVFILPF